MSVDAPEAPDTPGAGTPAVADAKPARPKSPRRRSREFALQGLYQWLLSSAKPTEIIEHLRAEEPQDFAKLDRAHFDALLNGCIEQAAQIDAVLHKHIDRPVAHLSPVEHSVLMIGVYELTHCIEIPYRVAINEAVELAKSFGGTDGHKYVNGVLDKASAELRPNEARGARPRR